MIEMDLPSTVDDNAASLHTDERLVSERGSQQIECAVPCATSVSTPVVQWRALALSVSMLLATTGAASAQERNESPLPSSKEQPSTVAAGSEAPAARADPSTESSVTAAAPVVEYDAATDRLRASVTDESLRRVMAAVSESTGVKIAISVPAEGEITASFDYMPFEEGLFKLLETRSYAVQRSDEDGRITRVWVLGKSTGTVSRRASPAKAAPRADRSDQPDPDDRLRATDAQLDAALAQMRHFEEQTGRSSRELLEQLRAQVDPGFNPETDGRELSDRELLQSIVESAMRWQPSGPAAAGAGQMMGPGGTGLPGSASPPVGGSPAGTQPGQ